MAQGLPAPFAAGVLPDVLAPDLDIVFCGTAAGAVSAKKGAYYAGPGNAFWPTLFAVGLTPITLHPSDYAALVQWRMGLTDLAKHVSGSDDSLARSHFDVARLRTVILEFRPKLLAFTSKRAAEVFAGHSVGYGLFGEKIGGTRMFALPSPSGAARRHWNAGHWRELALLRAAAADAGRPSGVASTIRSPCACSSAG